MGKVSQDILSKNLKSIERGSYWFGIIGRLSLLWGLFTAATILFVMITGGNVWGTSAEPGGQSFSVTMSPVTSLFYGWLFLKARDGFDAIAALIKEMDEVV